MSETKTPPPAGDGLEVADNIVPHAPAPAQGEIPPVRLASVFGMLPRIVEQSGLDALADWKEEHEAAPKFGRTLDAFQRAPDEADNPRALLHYDFLRKGQSCFFTSVSGSGKSTMTISWAIAWTLGAGFMGVEAVRPLRVAIVQTEDDEEDLAKMRDDAVTGLVRDCGLDEEAVRRAVTQIRVATGEGKTGAEFAAWLRAFAEKHRPDLVILNPLQAFTGCDISHNAELSEFLRQDLDPVVKDREAGFGLLVTHHTTKPPNKRERAEWGDDAYAQYITAGGSELNNWSRAAFTLLPTKAEGVYKMTAAKRGNALRWTDGDGNRARSRFVAHSADIQFWREATADEIAEATDGTARAGRGDTPPAGVDAVRRVLSAEAGGLSQNAIGVRVESARWGSKKSVRTALDWMLARGEVSQTSGPYGAHIYRLTPQEVEL